MRAISYGAFSLALLLFALQMIPLAAAQSQDLIVDICTTPNKYWNRQVYLKGHVVRVTPDPPGTNRGRYTLRDQSDKDIEVATDDLPAQGKVYVISGVVEQRKPGDNVPVVRESTRTLGQPDSTVGIPEKAPPAVAPAPAAAPAAGAARVGGGAGKAPTKAEIEEAVRKELERKEKEAQAKQAASAAPAPVTPAPAPVSPPAPSPGLLNNPIVIGGVIVLIAAIIGILFVTMRRKPAPETYAAPPAYPPPPSMAPPAPAGTETQAASGVATMVAAGRATEVITRLGGELNVTDGPDRGRNFVIGRPTTTIGRAGQRKNDLELTDTTVSREQAKILYNSADKSFKLINESTTNPTRVNGSTFDTAVLQDGDRIECGNTIVKFRKT
jgi:pSer/pThr/pTyr-binding forkhead associated (FHA) protein